MRYEQGKWETAINQFNDMINETTDKFNIIGDKFVQKGLKLAKDLNLTLNVGTSIYSEQELRLSLAIENLDGLESRG